MAPTVIIALPTAATTTTPTPTAGGMRVRNIEVRYPVGEALNGTTPSPPPGLDGGADSDDESDGEDSDGAETDDEDAAASGSFSAGLPLLTPVPETDTTAQTRIQSPEEETKEHWMVAMGSIGIAPFFRRTLSSQLTATSVLRGDLCPLLSPLEVAGDDRTEDIPQTG